MNITTDNASVNDVLVATLARHILSLYSVSYHKDSHVHCLNHVMNLVFQKLLASLGEADDPDEVDYFAQNGEEPIFYDVERDPDQILMEQQKEVDMACAEEEFDAGLVALEKEAAKLVSGGSAVKLVRRFSKHHLALLVCCLN
jgi:hypothetical protein